MIESYFSGVIEQVYQRIGQVERNIVMARYSNDFSIEDLPVLDEYGKNDEVFLACHEFDYGDICGAYEPFLETICSMFRKYGDGDFDHFLEESGVYALHREILNSYYETGCGYRQENVLLNEVKYEQRRMTEGIAGMLRKIAEKHPFVLVINRFQRASRSTLALVDVLLREPSTNIGLVLGANDVVNLKESSMLLWDKIVEQLEDCSQLYHIGSSGRHRSELEQEQDYVVRVLDQFAKVTNMFYLMDYENAKQFFMQVEHKIKFEDAKIDDAMKLRIFLVYAKTSILLGELSKALEIVAEIERLNVGDAQVLIACESAYLVATCYMYQGKLDAARQYAEECKAVAEKIGNHLWIFKADLLIVQIKMSGWYNIFFCVQDITVQESLIEGLMKYNWRNHLAYVYIYAYDNRPEQVARAYYTDGALFYFNKGMNIAKEIDNRELIYNAYQKNTMIAATNGMNEIAILYIARSHQYLNSIGDFHEGRTLTGIGYNLSALGYNEQAQKCFDRSIQVFYQLHRVEDIAEVFYNYALSNIMEGEYRAAEHHLQVVMKIIDKLHLNSLRVCNLSKLYALLALVYILLGERFNCERYLLNCRQFLNYIIEKDQENQEDQIIHDYANCDDDMFLYTFSSGLLHELNGESEEALQELEKAERYLRNAEGNQFYAYEVFRRKRMELFQKFGRMELYEWEKTTLEHHEQVVKQPLKPVLTELLDEIQVDKIGASRTVTEEEIESLAKQEGTARDYNGVRGQMEFISLWQKLIDTKVESVDALVENAMSMFLNHFSLDRAVYLYFQHQKPKVLYNDTGIEFRDDIMENIMKSMRNYPQGFAVSKIRESFFEHQDIIQYFGMDDVCSYIAVPYFKNDTFTSILITYVRMKDNWHSSIERYMLGEDDLRFYQLLFRELEYAIGRKEAGEKIRRMNRKLANAAVTDALTGIYNRAGLYESLRSMEADLENAKTTKAIGLMFIDLDNFKHYNDSFGHDIGDLILKQMAQLFTEIAGDQGTVSRYGGDEFIILFDTDDRETLETYAKEIYARIKATNGFKSQIESCLGRKVVVSEEKAITCSIGIAAESAIRTENDINELIKQADSRLYKVKTTKKGTYAFI